MGLHLEQLLQRVRQKLTIRVLLLGLHTTNKLLDKRFLLAQLELQLVILLKLLTQELRHVLDL